jgi:hypothetical protein
MFHAVRAVASESASLLERDLSPVILTLPKPVRMYSYFNVIAMTDELNSPEGRQKFLQRFFDATMGRFWDMNLTASQYINSGPGLYAAIDPHISQGFGNTMVEILVPAGTVFLDIHRNVILGEDTINALANEGIIARELMGELFVSKNGRFEFGRDTMKFMIKPEFSFFRGMMQELFLRRNVVMAEYNWDTSVAGFCRLHGYSAFVMFGAMRGSGIEDNFGKTLVFKNELPALTDEEKRSLATTAKFKKVLEELKSRKTYRDKVNFVNRSYTPAERDELVNQTYSCEL